MSSIIKQADVVIIGAGPAGLSFALAVAKLGLKVLILEKGPRKTLVDPPYDGREIALNFLSVSILESLNVWSRFKAPSVSPIYKAKILDRSVRDPLIFEGKNETPLGYLVGNHLIRRALQEAVSEVSAIEILTEVTVQNINIEEEHVELSLLDHRLIQAKLLVAADGRFSDTRRQCGIAVDVHDFARTMLVSQIKHEKSHHHIAYQYFEGDKVFALLPMMNFTSSLVVTLSPEEAKAWSQLPAAQFNRELIQRFGSLLGQVTLSSARSLYPLSSVYASSFIKKRVALIGDSAVTMHPVTAHGFNLGLQGQAILAESIQKAWYQNQDIGGAPVLEKYQREHRKITQVLYWGTRGVIGLLTTSFPGDVLLKQAVLKSANLKWLPFNRLIVNYLSGKSKSILPF